ncbi:MAG: hypothetical protein Q4C58_14205 [Eubacteriales bacterium]|nr:hypothetical protein [Eubacteriales bacterium]
MRTIRPLVLWSIGGLLYVILEMIWRGYSHWTMYLVGGICFLLIGAINEIIPWEMPLVLQCIIGALIVTAVEFLSGCIVNIWLGWHVWDYSDMPLNLLGQICLPFSLLWIFVSAVAIVLDDWLRYWLFDGEKPHYKLF